MAGIQDLTDSERTMPSKLDDETKRLNIVVPAAWARKVDEWRGKQQPLPNFSEALRQLVEIALEVEKKGRKRG